MKVGKIMHKGATTVTPATSVTSVAHTMSAGDIGIVPVAEKGRVIGVITDRDLATRALTSRLDPQSLKAQDIMTRKVVTCRAGDSIGKAIALMRKKKVRRIPVVGKSGQIVGMLALGDIAVGAKARQSIRLLQSVAGHHR
ncbi:MAG: CBS domain-containing protein [Rhodospirillaceae bacterium]